MKSQVSKSVFVIFLACFSAIPADAIDFQFEKDHCAAGEFQPIAPQSGGKEAGFFGLDDSAWAETGECMKFPIQKLSVTAADIGVMTWQGVTRIANVDQLPKQADQIFHVKIMYESSQRHFGCHTAQWPIEWTESVTEGSLTAPTRVRIEANRVPGGDSNGGYVKMTALRIEMSKGSDSTTSVHMRYEIQAPGQLADWALGSITNYFQYVTAVAGGGKAPGAIENSDCPNP